MFQYIFFLFSVIIFLILVRESIIDIKTMYVPDNITYSLYSVTFIFLILSLIINRSFNLIIKGFLGFLFGFGIPFTISLSSYLFYKFTKQKNKQNAINFENHQIDNINQSNNFQNSKTSFFKKIEFFIYITTLGLLLSIAIINNNDFIITLLLICAIILELIIAKIFKKFYKIEEDENDEEKEIFDTGIGGGDILIFGALGLMFGLIGIITIFIYATISQLFVILIYKIFSKKSLTDHLPFVPGITIGLYIYILTIFC